MSTAEACVDFAIICFDVGIRNSYLENPKTNEVVVTVRSYRGMKVVKRLERDQHDFIQS